jgi:hypothetical protein
VYGPNENNAEGETALAPLDIEKQIKNDEVEQPTHIAWFRQWLYLLYTYLEH